jgi:hypothetical protein
VVRRGTRTLCLRRDRRKLVIEPVSVRINRKRNSGPQTGLNFSELCYLVPPNQRIYADAVLHRHVYLFKFTISNLSQLLILSNAAILTLEELVDCVIDSRTSPTTNVSQKEYCLGAINLLTPLAMFVGDLTIATQFVTSFSEPNFASLLALVSELFLASLAGLFIIFLLLYGF